RRLGPATIRKTAADQRFREALREAGETPEMRQAQQDVADKKLLAPAIAQCERLGFRSALGLAVVLDSITHGSWERIAA
ncbi:chitosanase, partial [Escherichia coli]|nr:chitosanase [Escherichia coli]